MISRFVADLPGQPPSWNSSYRITHQRARDRQGQPVLNTMGEQKTYSTLTKQKAVIEYQQMARLILNTAKPSEFRPEGFVYVVYEFFLARDIDCDNVMKAINDVLALSLDINDRMFLPAAMSKESGCKDPYVRLTVLDAAYWRVGPIAR